MKISTDKVAISGSNNYTKYYNICLKYILYKAPFRQNENGLSRTRTANNTNNDENVVNSQGHHAVLEDKHTLLFYYLGVLFITLWRKEMSNNKDNKNATKTTKPYF